MRLLSGHRLRSFASAIKRPASWRHLQWTHSGLSPELRPKQCGRPGKSERPQRATFIVVRTEAQRQKEDNQRHGSTNPRGAAFTEIRLLPLGKAK
ncbi:hypothetical protein HPB50_013677 [Hyalomma asiaticum]|uniref:Uncharacterized protein n=1 Tax=Hyalomma asiaticum TaxID=266040 RepID=A0ACB7TNP7_HYAAI|nr:hypothetical protein HPB50_013677 [Hyalomma asiaticum]